MINVFKTKRVRHCVITSIACMSVYANSAVDDSAVVDMTDEPAGLFIAPSFMFSEINIDNDFASDSVSESIFGVSLSAGYYFDSGISIALSGAFAENFSMGGAFDRYSLSHKDISVGYKFEWETFSFVPMYGIAKWDLTSKEGQLLNSGEEAAERLKGMDNLWGINFLGKINNVSEANLSYKKINSEFGGYYLVNMGVSLNF